ncbi:MAG: SIMPL domain-containing protein [Casimicrobiaceae bacterium]
MSPVPVRDVLALDTTVASEVTPDLAVITLAAEAAGADPAILTREVQQAINAGLALAKKSRDIEARTGGFNTQPRWSPKGGRDGWTVRAELILKSRDFGALGTLAGQLAQQKLLIVSSGFEISRELREREEAALTERAIATFQAKARTAARAFGFAGFHLREVNLGTIGGELRPQPRPMLARAAEMAAAPAEPVAIEAGRVTLMLTVAGSVQLLK